jgi:hypothetical protein
MELILYIFKQLSGLLRLISRKSEIFYFGKAKEVEEEYKHIFGCEVGSLQFKYHGIPNYLED